MKKNHSVGIMADSVPAAVLAGITALLNTANVPQERINQAVSIIEGRAVAVSQEKAEQLDAPVRLEPCVTRPELAKLLKCGVRNIDYHRRAGHLKPVFIAGSTRARGFTAESVRALLRGDFAKVDASSTSED